MKSLSIDLNAYGIIVFSLYSGWFKTDMSEHNAAVSIDERVEGIIRVVGKTDIKDTRKFLYYDGIQLPQ